jgi:hypothetical protein
MKLIEILEPLFESGIKENKLMGNNLKPFKNLLLKCDEFKYVTELNILDQACMGGKNGYSCVIHKLNKNFSFNGVVNIFQFIRTPPMYDTNILYEPILIKNNATISPAFCKPDNISINKRRITMEVDLDDFTHDSEKLLSIFRDIIYNYKDYEPKPFYGYMVSGVFENFNNRE